MYDAALGRAEQSLAAGDPTAALHECRAVLAADPRCAPAHMTMGRIMRAVGEVGFALEHMEAAARLEPDSAAIALELAELLVARGRFPEAGGHIDRAIAAAPQAAAPVVAAVDLVLRTGDTESAAARADRLLARFPNHIGAIRTAALAYTAVGRHDDAIGAIERVLAADLETRLRGPLLFVLARARAARGDHDGAWEAARAANAAKGLRLDRPAHAQRVARILDAFDERVMTAVSDPVSTSAPRPIFIAGMPRSGTTLVDQILASHPDVAGAGELGLLERIGHRVDSDLPFPRWVASISPDAFAELARFARDTLAAGAGGRPVVTEKSVSSAFYLGILPRLLPDARVVFCERDPLDTCVSCYFIDFESHLPYAYDLGDLGVFHASHDRLVAHWRDVLPLPWTTVRYEDLVVDQETTTRALLDFCGLPFHARCLKFHETDRPVLTASAQQVRQPLYASSVGRHRKYARHLGQLREALAHEPASAT